MSLATRLSLFFLAALALVLAGFSGTLYLLARAYLGRQLDERLQRALDTLDARPAGTSERLMVAPRRLIR